MADGLLSAGNVRVSLGTVANADETFINGVKIGTPGAVSNTAQLSQDPLASLGEMTARIFSPGEATLSRR